MPTDTERLDFLERQKRPTMHIGFDIPSGGWSSSCTFGGRGLRREIDNAMKSAEWYSRKPINEVR